MPGYADTKKLIEDTLVNRPAGTVIVPEDHQTFALSMLDYIHAVELLGASSLQGAATVDTVPVQPIGSRVSYISSVPPGQTYVYTNFLDENGQAISVTSGANTVSLLTLLWNGSYWTVSSTPVTLAVGYTNGYLFKGIAVPTDNPGTPDQNVFYIASQTGTYTNFGGLAVADGEVAILRYNGSWAKEITGAATAEKVTRLEAEVADIKEGNFSEYKGEVATTLTEKTSLYAAKAATSYASNSNGWSVKWYKTTKKTIFRYAFETNVANGAAQICISDAEPAAGVSCTVIVKEQAAKSTGYIEVAADKYVGCVGNEEAYFATLYEQVYETTNIIDEVAALEAKIDDAYEGPSSLAEMLDIMRKFHDFRYVDIMPLTSNSVAPLTKIGIFTPVSATATTITLSAEDAACIDSTMALVCRTTNDKYYIGQFSAASSNVITLLYDYGVGIDLSTVNALMSIHDTIRNGNGQHLSPWGYKAIAEAIASQTMSKYWMSNSVVSGFTTINCNNATSWETPDIVRTSDNVVVCSPTYNSSWKTSGRTGIIPPSGTAPYNQGGVVNLSATLGAWFTARRYQCQQAVAGAKMQFPLPVFNRKVSGFVKVSCNCPKEGDFDGTAKLNVYGDGVLVGYANIPAFADVVCIPVNTKVSSVTVELEILEDKNTQVNIGTFAFYENYSEDIKPIDGDSIVAIAGSSNTQYPPSNAAYIGLVSGDPFNVIVTRPDGTTGDGYGYYPKELAKVTGATVDNWGKSGELTTYGLQTIHGIFQNKRYSHIIFSYFANDMNAAGNTYKGLTKRVWELCEYAKMHGAIPVMIMSCGTSSKGQKASFARFHEYLMMGVWYQHIAD